MQRGRGKGTAERKGSNREEICVERVFSLFLLASQSSLVFAIFFAAYILVFVYIVYCYYFGVCHYFCYIIIDNKVHSVFAFYMFLLIFFLIGTVVVW